MAALEAAFSSGRCAIVAITIFRAISRDLGGRRALLPAPTTRASLADNIRLLNNDRPMRRAYAETGPYTRARERFTTKRMIDDCLQLYRSLVTARSVAA